jgi:hypothetical protein
LGSVEARLKSWRIKLMINEMSSTESRDAVGEKSSFAVGAISGGGGALRKVETGRIATHDVSN